MNIWVFDVEDEYSAVISMAPKGSLSALTPDHLRFNLFQPPGPWVSTKSWLNEICLLLRGLWLRDASINLLRTGMRRLLRQKGVTQGMGQWPSLNEVIEFFRGKRYGPKSRNAGYLESILNRLESLADTLEQTAQITSSSMLTDLARRSVIFRLQGLAGLPLQFLVKFLLIWLTRYQEGVREYVMVVVDEYHEFVAEKGRTDVGEDPLCRVSRTGRKRGIALVIADQLACKLPEAVLGNLGCRGVLRLVDAKSIWSLQSSMGLKRDQAEKIPQLEPRHAIVQYQLHPTPFEIRIPDLEFPPPLSEHKLAKIALEAVASSSWQQEQDTPEHVRMPPKSVVLEPDDLVGDPLQIMMRICEHPAESIEQRCKALEMDRAREFRGRGELLTRGYLVQFKKTISGKVKFFQPTAKGVAWAEKHKIRLKRYKSGPLHEFILSEIERRICLIGPRWRLQRNSSIAREQGLQPDLLVMVPSGRRVIVEICCSNVSYDAENIVCELQIGDVDALVAVTPDKQSMRALSNAIGKAMVALNGEDHTPISVFDAGLCLSDDFDWAAVLEAQT